MRSVVVTGLGCITPAGGNVQESWDSLLTGKNIAATVTSFDTNDMDRHIGCQVRWRQSEMSESRYGRATVLAFVAGKQAVADAGLSQTQQSKMAVCVGSTMSEIFDGVPKTRGLAKNGQGQRFLFEKAQVNHIGQELARKFSSQGPTIVIPTACAAGNYAIGYGSELISSGRVSIALAGGADAFSRIAFIGFARLNAMSPDLCRPFDRNRQGMLVSEGSAFLVLEEEQHARKRRAKIYARILSCGISCDGHHIAAPHPKGAGAALAIRLALKDARIEEKAVDYISAHGTGTIANDRVETMAVKKVFGKRATRIPISSIKSILGHAMGAASAIEAVMCCKVISHRTILPTWNYQERDPQCDLDYVPNEPRKQRRLDVILSNSFAFGGNNACLAIGRYLN